MDYQSHYDRLISRARGRSLHGYRERHHVVPKCMGGSNAKDNLVDLTAEEHYVAHQLLCKLYPDIRGLATAAVRMSKQCAGNKAYGWLRRRHADHTSKRMQGNTFATIKTPEHRARLSASHLGIRQSQATIEKRSASLKGHTTSDSTRAKIGAANRGKAVGIKRPPRTAEHLRKLSEAGMRRVFAPVPDERKIRIAASLRAYWNRKLAGAAHDKSSA